MPQTADQASTEAAQRPGPPTVTAAQRLVQVLLAEGVTHVFCVPGESYLAVLDALVEVADRIQVISCRHEAGAANMAVAHGKLTGRPGICMVTRGPGATHASIGVHTASQDSAPMILFVGQVARAHKGREAFQELDYGAVFGSMAKWAAEIDDPSRIAELVGRAFTTAVQGRAGPVVLALPEDMLVQPVTASPVQARQVARAGLDRGALGEIAARLKSATRPILILGGAGWTSDALSGLASWAAACGLPVALSFRRKDLLDNDHPCYVGDLGLGADPALIRRVREADLVIALGARLGENPSQGYTLFDAEQSQARLVHIHPGATELGRVWPAAITAVADLPAAADALCEVELAPAGWEDWRAAAKAELLNFRKPVQVTGAVNLCEIFAHLREALPADAIVCNGAGNYAAWLHRCFTHHQFGTQLAPTSGAMGFGFPAAIAAKLIRPDREVVAVAGDGCFLMTAQELATAIHYEVRMVILVVDNGAYGTIRMHQERAYPGRPIATDLTNPDFAAYARAFGAWAVTVSRTEDFPAALHHARNVGRPALIHLVTSVRDIAPGRTLSD